MSTEHRNVKKDDVKILDILEKNPQKGMTLLVEFYTGLIWKVISFHLTNPEDIKECTNDTFAEFYFHKEKFDPKKTSLDIYLAVIARNLAVSRYRRELIRQAGELPKEYACADSQIELAEARVDLEKAFAVLKPDESQIIRMKYYEGMTVQEIADSMNLPYETVKKRHQRSIGKLRQGILLMLLILALPLITACSYKILVYYNVIPDFLHICFPGFTDDESEEKPDAYPVVKPLIIHIPDQTDYPEWAETEGFDRNISFEIDTGQAASTKETYTLPDFTYVSGYGINWEPDAPYYAFQGAVPVENEWMKLEITDAVCVNHSMRVEVLCTSKEEAWSDLVYSQGLTSGSPLLVYENSAWKMAYISSRSLSSYQSKCEIYYDNVELPAISEGTIQMTLSGMYQFGQPLSFTLAPANEEKNGNYAWQMEEYGGLLAVPRLENGSLIVEIHPVSNDENFVTLPGITRARYGESEGGTVTVTGPDGIERIGTCIGYNPSDRAEYFEWDFGPAEPGEYTLHVPYVYQEAVLPEDFMIPINLENCTWEDRTYDLPEGSIWVENCAESELKDGRAAWEIQLRWQSDNSRRTITQIYLSAKGAGINFQISGYDIASGGMNGSALASGEEYNASGFCLTPPSNNAIYKCPVGVTYRWNQSFDLPFSVNSSE